VSGLTIARRLRIGAPPERVWECLTTPALLVTCLPGAALESSSEDGLRHDGSVTVKLGAISVTYRGTAEYVTVDEAARTLNVKAKGRERTGAGSADMDMRSEVLAAADGSSELSLEASINVSGKIVTMGRGMIGIVADQMIDEFSECLAGKLAASEGAPSDAGVAAPSEVGLPEQAPPAQGLAILWRALRSWLRRLFRRT
jgi:carbon monoxide dehydrogenase subunit G